MSYSLPTWANGSAGGSKLNATNINIHAAAITDLDVRAGIDPGAPSGSDDTAALQAAAAAASTAGHGVIALRAGTYKVNDCVELPDDTTLRGAGKGVTLIQGISGLSSSSSTNGGYTILSQDVAATQNITVRDLTVDGNYSATGIVLASADRENAGVVDFRGITNLQLINVEVTNGWFYHLAVWDSTDVLVQGCTVTGPGTTGTYDQLDGIHLVGVTRGAVIGNRVDMGVGADGDDGVAVRVFPAGDDCTDIVIVGNTVRGGTNGAGIDLANSDGALQGVTISGNLIHDCAGPGIITQWFDEFTGATSEVTIVGNTVRDCGNSIVVGDESENDAPYSLFRVAHNQCISSTSQPYQASTANSSDIVIERTSLPPVTLAYAATRSTDASLSCHFRITLTGNMTLSNPTDMTDGQEVTWELIQDATGSRVLTLDSAFALGTTITSTTLTTTADARDFLTAIYNAAEATWYVTRFVTGY